MKQTEWTKRWNFWINPEPVSPGVYKKKDGGFLVRALIPNPMTGKREEAKKVVKAGRASEATRARADMIEERRAATQPNEKSKQRFATYAVSLLRRKLEQAEIRSKAGTIKWDTALRLHLIPRFGHFRMCDLTHLHVADWRDEMARLAKADKLAPSTANSRLGIMRVICRTAKPELRLRADLVEAVRDVPMGDWRTYTVDEPNSLTPDELPEFLVHLRSDHPQHFAMAALGFVTGLRPSHISPIRRRGPEPDVRWKQRDVLVRRSQTYGQVMNTAKTGKDQCISLPDELFEIMDWHVDNLRLGDERESVLLFPSRNGGFRGHTVLDKPFAAVAKKMKLGKKVTPRAMRRTFNDIARVAGVEDQMTRAVSGHSTIKMHWHYSTIGREEMRKELGRVMDVAGFSGAMAT